jgi:glycosyltransferase involved in cell wall biosynthesis
MSNMARDGFVFVSTMMGFPWGGSEELWSRAALDLAAQGFPVSASVAEWSPPHERVLGLMQGGVDVRFRPSRYSLGQRLWRRATRGPWNPITVEAEKVLAAHSHPALVVLADGGPFPWIELPEFCVERQLPFVTIAQANPDNHWLADDKAARYRAALAKALRCYFVSNANRGQAERQLGAELPNAEIVWNPFNIAFDACPPWPGLRADDELRLACVARMEPHAKGQDILLEALAKPVWRERNWRLNLYGAGPSKDVLERLAARLGLAGRAVFAGHRPVEEIWAANHLLVLPSRYEGLPLAMVEAMLCARPVVATDVAGHAEVIEDGVTGFLADAPTIAGVEQALERMWARRDALERMGEAGSRRIRGLVPQDPAKVFSEKIKRLVMERIDP